MWWPGDCIDRFAVERERRHRMRASLRIDQALRDFRGQQENPSYIGELPSCAQATITIARNLSCIVRNYSMSLTPNGAAFSRARSWQAAARQRRGPRVG